MKPKRDLHNRVLAIAPSYRGFGFAMMDGDALVDWGVSMVTKDKNVRCLSKVESFLDHYQPDLMAMENYAHSRRSPQIRTLVRQITKLAASRDIRVKLFTRGQINRAFCANDRGSKNALAEAVAKRFPDELGFRLPPKRRPWMSEDYRMDIFDAAAFGLMARLA